MDVVLKSVMYLTVVFAGPEDDGSFNYLLERKMSGTERQYSISHSYPSDMGLKEGDSFYALVEATCSEMWALDKTPPSMESSFPWGIPRRAYICNAETIKIGNKTYKSLIRGNHGK